ncbi:MAG: hypothetical protein KDK55_03950 [Chlamydiia bacterium]|nr:hypothetical protein [Chlamydiia bacterium]
MIKQPITLLLLFIFIGTIHGFGDQTEYYNEATTVMANKASYDGSKIYLSGEVIIENKLGKAVAKEAILQKTEKKENPINFSFVELSGEVKVTLTDGKHLLCERVALDLIALTSLFEGKKQVFYQDEKEQIFADKVLIDYEKGENEKLSPQKVTLMGHVQMKEKTNEGFRFALADCAIIDPKTEKILLEGREDRQVLFFDEQRKIQLAAKRIEAKRNTITGKESIQGFGAVKFVLAQEEFNKIKKSFSLS